jgi:hypothetical protein
MVAHEGQLAGEEVLEGDELFVALHDGVGAFFPGQSNAGPKTVLQARPFVPGAHDARAGPRDDHPAGGGHLASKVRRLFILRFLQLGAGGAEDGDFALLGVRFEQAEGVAQFAHGGADQPHVAPVLHVGQQLEGIENNVGHQVLVVAASLIDD